MTLSSDSSSGGGTSRPEKILWLASQATFNKEYAEEDLRNWLMQFIERFFRQQYKSSCSPDGGATIADLR